MLKFYQGRKGRRVQCRTCGPCLTEDCGACANCLDKPRFGGQNRRKQACIKRKCVSLTTTFQPKVTPKLATKIPTKIPIVAAKKKSRRRPAPLPSLSPAQPAKEVTKPKSPFTSVNPKQKKALTPGSSGAMLLNLSRRASQDTRDPDAAPLRSPAPAQLTATSHASVAGSPLRPWVKYAPSPSHASPSAGILKSKRTADDLDSSNDVSFTKA